MPVEFQHARKGGQEFAECILNQRGIGRTRNADRYDAFDFWRLLQRREFGWSHAQFEWWLDPQCLRKSWQGGAAAFQYSERHQVVGTETCPTRRTEWLGKDDAQQSAACVEYGESHGRLAESGVPRRCVFAYA